jgi:ketosteroid isomerase-like protein
MTDDPQELVARVRAMYDAFNRRDVEGALQFVAPDAQLRPSGTAARTGRVVYRGHDELREYFSDVADVWGDGLQLEPDAFRAVSGSVVVFGRVSGDAGDGPMEDQVVWVWRLRDGLVITGQVFSTRRAALEYAAAGDGRAEA